MSARQIKIVEILQKHCVPSEFYVLGLAEKPEFYKVAEKITQEILVGKFFAGDLIEFEEDKNGICSMEIVEISEECRNKEDFKELQLDLKQLLNGHFTKFLNHTLPISAQKNIKVKKAEAIYINGVFQGKYLMDNQEVGNITARLKSPFIGKIQQKTRITLYPNSFNPFFFVIASSNNFSVKIVFWKESLELYSSLEPGDNICVTEFKRKKKTVPADKIVYNTFTETRYFDCEEVTARELFLVDLEKTGVISRLFPTIQGKVLYSSVILKMEHLETYQEYVLIRLVDNGNEINVVLFNNSQDCFYDLKGQFVRLFEMRKVSRDQFSFYLSTIYTYIEIVEDENVEIETVSYNLFDETVTKKIKKTPHIIYGAIGFLPDFYENISEISSLKNSELISGKDVPVDHFYSPVFCTLENINLIKLAINECKKFYFKNTVSSIEPSDVTIEYIEEDRIRDQQCYLVSFTDSSFVYLISNFFTNQKYQLGIYDGIQEIKKALVGNEMYLFVDAMRISSDNILIYLTGFQSV
ncbi:hypothetical protein NUSPORA_01457 [Nucleospora cyclopteri]